MRTPAPPVNSAANDAEAKPWLRRIGSFMPTFFVMGVAIPALIYIAIMVILGWRTPIIGANAGVSYSPAESKIYLYVSTSTTSYVSRVGGNYNFILTPWRAYFATRKHDVTEINSLGQMRRQPGSILILPSTVTLSEQERGEIQAFRSSGGAVLATWATGTRTAGGEWQGWQFLEQLGARMVGEMSTQSTEHHLVLTGESPVSHTQPAGMRIWMSKTTEPLLRLRGEMIGARFTNWARVVDDDRRNEGALIFSEGLAAAGRAAVFGFAETTWESHPLHVYPLIDDTLQWLRREPTIVRAAWPMGRRAAQVIEMDTEEGFNNATGFADMMRAQQLPGTFFVLTSVAKQHAEVLKGLARDFEIGYHGDVHDGFKGQPITVQERRIATMRSDLAALLPNNRALGFRAPNENYGGVTESLLQKAGIRYHAADPDRSEARLPFIPKMEGIEPQDSIVVLQRTQRDDINFAAQRLSGEQTLKEMLDDFDLTVETGGLGWVSVHSQNFAPGSALASIFPGFLQQAKQRGPTVWFASAGEVAQWWRDRLRFRASGVNTGKRLELNVTVMGNDPVKGGSLVLMLPFRNAVPTIRPVKVGVPTPSRMVKLDAFRMSIVFDNLEPGNYTYQITFVGGQVDS